MLKNRFPFHPRTLQQRFAVFMLLPVALLLLVMGTAGFLYANNSMLTQWGENAILKLAWAAHHVDMRLGRPKQWMGVFNKALTEPVPAAFLDAVAQELNRVEGVIRVDLNWAPPESSGPGILTEIPGAFPPSARRLQEIKITPPRYDALMNHATVSLVSDVNGNGQTRLGNIEVVLRFNYLIENIVDSGWWRNYKALLIDDSGSILTCTLSREDRKEVFGQTQLEKATLQAMKKLPYGVVIGNGFPPEEVSGFFRLAEAPWTLVVIAPGKAVLSPIVRFNIFYLLTGGACIMAILFLMRKATGNTVSAIKAVSRAAGQVAEGNYTIRLAARTQDEVGELIQNFNTMTFQLEERIRLKKALDLAMEVQLNLLPSRPLDLPGVDIAGKSIYCDETGGDYYDFFRFDELGPEKVGVAVGDVVGHGVAAALLMTTARALLRSRIIQAGGLAQVTADVNRLLCIDTELSGSFMTLFLAVLDPASGSMEWVRAGHEPALVYDPQSDTFSRLEGNGLALGVDPEHVFQQNSLSGLRAGQILLISTDGITETKNPEGAMFGRKRLKNVIRDASGGNSENIVAAVISELESFRRGIAPKDDITLVVVKIKPLDA